MGLSSICRQLLNRIDSEDLSERVNHTEYDAFYKFTSDEAFQNLKDQIVESGDPNVIIKNLPKSE